MAEISFDSVMGKKNKGTNPSEGQSKNQIGSDISDSRSGNKILASFNSQRANLPSINEGTELRDFDGSGELEITSSGNLIKKSKTSTERDS